VIGDCCVFKLLRYRVDGKHLMRFESENTVSKFLRRVARMDGKHFENEAFRKQSCHDNHVISLLEVFFKLKSTMTGDCCVFKFLRCSVDEKLLMIRFQSENTVQSSNFSGVVWIYRLLAIFVLCENGNTKYY